MLSKLRISDIAASISLTASAISSGVIALARMTSAADGELVRRSGTSLVGYALSNLAAAVHTHAASDTTAGTLDLARMVSGATAGAPVRVNAAGTALETPFPPCYISDGDSITTTPTVLLTITLPAAGTYLVRSSLATVVGTVTGTRNITAQVDATNFTSCALTAAVLNSMPNCSTRTTITTNSAQFTVGHATNNSGEFRIHGKLVVSDSSTVTITMSIAGDSGSLRGGSWIDAVRIS